MLLKHLYSPSPLALGVHLCSPRPLGIHLSSPSPLGIASQYIKRKIFSWRPLATQKNSHDVVRTGHVSSELPIPSHIKQPPYVIKKRYPTLSEIEIKNERQIERMRRSCLMARKVLDTAASQLRVGNITRDTCM
jgi:methionyl aminopeptidase